MKSLHHRVAKIFLATEQFRERLLETMINAGVLQNALDAVNAIQRSHLDDPYQTLDELKAYDPATYESTVGRFREKLEMAYRRLKFGSRGVRAWRAVSLKDPPTALQMFQTRGTGIYWSYDLRGARPYWGRSDHKTVVLHAEIPIDSVNFAESAKANTSTAFSAHEQEVQAIRGAPVWVEAIAVDKEVNPVKDWFKA